MVDELFSYGFWKPSIWVMTYRPVTWITHSKNVYYVTDFGSPLYGLQLFALLQVSCVRKRNFHIILSQPQKNSIKAKQSTMSIGVTAPHGRG